MTAIERSVWEYFSGKAEQKGRDLSELLTAAVATARFLCRGLFSSAISRSLSRSKTRSSSSDSGPVFDWTKPCRLSPVLSIICDNGI